MIRTCLSSRSLLRSLFILLFLLLKLSIALCLLLLLLLLLPGQNSLEVINPLLPFLARGQIFLGVFDFLPFTAHPALVDSGKVPPRFGVLWILLRVLQGELGEVGIRLQLLLDGQCGRIPANPQGLALAIDLMLQLLVGTILNHLPPLRILHPALACRNRPSEVSEELDFIVGRRVGRRIGPVGGAEGGNQQGCEDGESCSHLEPWVGNGQESFVLILFCFLPEKEISGNRIFLC